MLRQPLAAGLVIALLAGCATTPAGPPAPPAAGNQFDGSYTGNNTQVRGGGEGCGPPAFVQSLIVQGGRFNYPFAPNPPVVTQVPVQVFADGTFLAKIQYGINEPTPLSLYKAYWLSIKGQITNGVLDATIDTQICVRHLQLQKQ
jgi:hypothetical protein